MSFVSLTFVLNPWWIIFLILSNKVYNRRCFEGEAITHVSAGLVIVREDLLTQAAAAAAYFSEEMLLLAMCTLEIIPRKSLHLLGV